MFWHTSRKVRHFSTSFIYLRVPAYSGAFFLADQPGIGCPKIVRFEPPNVIEILKSLWEGKKQIVQILTNRGYKIVE